MPEMDPGMLSCSSHRSYSGQSANADISVGFSQPSPLTLPLMAAETAMAADKGTPPHPEQGGIRIMEAYFLEISEVECIWRFRYFSQCSLDHVWSLSISQIYCGRTHHASRSPSIPDPLITPNHYHASALRPLHSHMPTCAVLRISEIGRASCRERVFNWV